MGPSVNNTSGTTTSQRNTLNPLDSNIGAHPSVPECPQRSDQYEEEHQQDAHRGAKAEVPLDERTVVDVGDEKIRRLRWRSSEEHERGTELSEGPQEQQKQKHGVDWTHQPECDVADLLPHARAVDRGGLVEILGDGLHPGHGHQEGERPLMPNGDHNKGHEGIVADKPERGLVKEVEVVHQYLIHHAVVTLQHELPGLSLIHISEPTR